MLDASLPDIGLGLPHKPVKNMPLVVADYTLEKNLGMGAFGKVKRAVHKHTKAPVAVKVMNHKRIESQNMSEKVKREITILNRCSHAHVMRMFDVINTPTDLFVVCEFVTGTCSVAWLGWGRFLLLTRWARGEAGKDARSV